MTEMTSTTTKVTSVPFISISSNRHDFQFDWFVLLLIVWSKSRPSLSRAAGLTISVTFTYGFADVPKSHLAKEHSDVGADPGMRPRDCRAGFGLPALRPPW